MNIKNVNLKFNMNKIATGNKPNAIVVHNADASNCTVNDIHRWHLENGWAGIGYHYFVRKNGEIYKGREDNWIGSHCAGHNTNTLGVCFEGKYNSETMPETQLKAGRELISYLKNKYGITKVYKHKDLYNTDCPGKNFPFDALVNSSTVSLSKPSQSTNNNGDSWVKRLQNECNVQGFSKQIVDGYPGPNTLQGCPTLREGATGNITRLLQEKLVSLGYDTNGVDGIFGSGTKSAVIKFQATKGLSQDGIVGHNTWKALLGL